MAFFSIFKDSAREFKNLKCLATCGILVALYVVLEVFCSINTGYFKVNFAYIALAVIGMLYGPTVAAVAAIPCDILAVVFKGLAVNLLFTPIAMLEAAIYGVFLYRKVYGSYKFSADKLPVLISKTVAILVCNLTLNTVAVYYTVAVVAEKYAFGAYFGVKLVKNLLELPFDLVLMYFVLVSASMAYKKIKIRG